MTVYRRPDPIPLGQDVHLPATQLEPIQNSRKELSILAAQRIFAAIASKNWAQTGLLPREDILGQELGVSRTVVREAVKLLSSKSIVETRRRRGTMIMEQSDWNFVDSDMIDWMSESNMFPDVSDQLIDALAMTQSELLSQIAADRLGASTLQPLAQLIGGSPKEAAAVALTFHLAAAQLYQNDFLLSLTTSIVRGLKLHHMDMLAEGGFGSSGDSYIKLCDAIENNDVDAVRKLNSHIFNEAFQMPKSTREQVEATV